MDSGGGNRLGISSPPSKAVSSDPLIGKYFGWQRERAGYWCLTIGIRCLLTFGTSSSAR